MKCSTKLDPAHAEAIQIAHSHLLAHKEAIMDDLKTAFIKAILSGIELKNIKIVETTTWSNQERKADYVVRITDKREG